MEYSYQSIVGANLCVRPNEDNKQYKDDGQTHRSAPTPYILALAVCLVSFSAPAWARIEKAGYVDVAKVFDGYQKTKDNDAKLQTAGKKKEEERDALVHEVRRLKDEQALLGEDAREKKQEAIDVKIKELQEFDAAARRELGEERNQKVREIFKDIDEVVQRYGERKGYDLIFNDRVLLYRNPRFDLSKDILDELNRNYQTKKPK